MRRVVITLGLALACAATGQAATLYTPILSTASTGTQSVDCKALNVSKATINMAFGLFDAQSGTELTAVTCTGVPPGASCSIGPLPAPISTDVYCQVTLPIGKALTRVSLVITDASGNVQGALEGH